MNAAIAPTVSANLSSRETVRTRGGIVKFVPTLFIGVGRLGCFFTLRETELNYIPSSRPGGNAVVNGVYQGSVEVGSFHHYNLSQDPDEAYAKACEAATNMGLRLNTTRESLAEEMAEIQRATADQLAEREAREIRQRADMLERQAREHAQALEVITAGFWPITRNAGSPIECVGPSYLAWLIAKREEFEDGSLFRLIADKVAAEYTDLLLPVPDLDMTVGAVGERRDFLNLRVIRTAYFDSDFGRVHVTTFITPDGACVVYKSSAFAADVDDRVSLKATIKAHDRYNGQMQTVIQRAKELKA